MTKKTATKVAAKKTTRAASDKKTDQYKAIVDTVAELFKQADDNNMFVGIGRTPMQKEEGPLAKQLRQLLTAARVYK